MFCPKWYPTLNLLNFFLKAKSYANRNIAVRWEDFLCLIKFIQQIPKIFYSVVILFKRFEGLYKSLSEAFFRCAKGARARSSAFPGKAC